nr:MAG TPA: hypothetical protein [Caudoviricetes sp.]
MTYCIFCLLQFFLFYVGRVFCVSAVSMFIINRICLSKSCPSPVQVLSKFLARAM